uniref:Peroxidase n=1 Tax=Cajanus cajan TaxID=3821 RepID=A0A151U1C2_CAJCA|nr:Peroxidase 4 [Cajanus cajan]
MASYYFLLLVLVGATTASGAELCTDFYSCNCPNLLPIVKKGVAKALQKEPRMGASLLRLHFHDCFVNNIIIHLTLLHIIHYHTTLRFYEIKLAYIHNDIMILGGPSWEVGLGRRDSTTASRSDANNSIPAPSLSLTALIKNFANQGLSVTDLVALSGAHTIGLAQCKNFRAHIYNDSNVDPSYRKNLQSKCPKSGNDNIHEALDHQTPIHFDNLYFQNLVSKKALLHSDQELFNGSSTDNLVKKYATNTAAFFEDFAKGMVKLSNIKPLTGSKGQIRINCGKVN